MTKTVYSKKNVMGLYESIMPLKKPTIKRQTKVNFDDNESFSKKRWKEHYKKESCFVGK